MCRCGFLSDASVFCRWFTSVPEHTTYYYAVGIAQFRSFVCSARLSAVNVQGPKMLAPHNWAIMYRLNDNTRRLFNRWRILHIAKSRVGSDQVPHDKSSGKRKTSNETILAISNTWHSEFIHIDTILKRLNVAFTLFEP